jgi:ABC-type branched-subunit amino acid transport system substrate-binding protein
VSVRVTDGIGVDFLDYRIEELLGQGGMGVVYRAYDVRLKRTIALKLMAPEFALDERFRERFSRESELAMSLEHPNVVPIHDAGELDGRLYLAMRYVEGTDLRSRLRDAGALAPVDAVAIVNQVARALDAAHRKGLVHRDVKPSNVLLDASDHVYLADFGLTRRFAEQGVTFGDARSLGTPAYLAPEQIEGRPVDGRADVYSLGCMLYECLTGTAPFPRGSRLEMVWAHLEDEPPSASEWSPALPEAIDDVIAKGMAKDPDDRYGTCAELAAAAEDALGLREAPTSSRRVLLLAAAALLVALAVLVAALVTRGGDEPAAAPPVIAATQDSARATDEAGVGVLDPASGELLDTIPLGTSPSNVAVGEGAVWVLDADDRTVSRIDPETRAVQRTFSTASTPTDLAAGAGAVWIGNGGDFGSFPVSVSRVDPQSGVVDATIDLPGSGVRGYLQSGGFAQQFMAVTDDAVWVVNPDQTVSRIDPRTNEIVAKVDVRVSSIAAGDGSVWVVDEEGVAEIDQETNAIAGRTDVKGERLASLAVGAGAVWAADPLGGSVWRIDPRPDDLQRTIPIGLGVNSVTFGEGAVWATNEVANTVYRIDPSTNRAQLVSRMAAPGGVALGETGVWVTSAGQPSVDAALPASACRDVYYRGAGSPRFLIVSDLPLQGGTRAYTSPMVDAIRFVLERRGFKAGPYAVGYQSCDDATAQAGGFDLWRCFTNAKAYARTPDVIGVIGTFNWGCSMVEIPVANQATGGPLAMISPANTPTFLTRPVQGAQPAQLEELYPSGERNFVRIAAADHLAVPALVEAARELGADRVAVLVDQDDPDMAAYAAGMRERARAIGLELADSAAWDPFARGFDALARRVAAARPDAVLLAGAGPPHVDSMLRDLRARLGRRVALIASDGFWGVSGPDARGMYIGNYGIPNTELPASGKQFLKELEASGGDPGPDVSAVYGAQAAEILLDAIARSDGTRSSVTRELRATRVEDGLLGDIRFDEYGDLVEGPVTIYRIAGERMVVDRVVVARGRTS